MPYCLMDIGKNHARSYFPAIGIHPIRIHMSVLKSSCCLFGAFIKRSNSARAPLQLLPHQPVPAGFGEAFSELPDRRVVRKGLGEAEESLEAEAIHNLALQFGVAEAVPLLEHQHLYHHDGVDVRSASLGAFVVVEGLNDGGEGFPVYEGFYLG